MNRRKQILTLTAIAVSAVLFGCAKQNLVEPVPDFSLEVPRGVRYAEPDANISTSSDRTVFVFGGRGYIGTDIMFDAQEARDRLKDIVSKNSAKEIYLQADPNAEYIEVLIYLNAIRGGGSHSVALITRSLIYGALGKLSVQLSQLPGPNDASSLKPNPLALEVEVRSDRKLFLNKNEITTLDDLDKLTNLLTDTIKSRTNISDKTVSVKGTRSLRYGDIVNVIDAVKGTDSPVVLVLDDLP